MLEFKQNTPYALNWDFLGNLTLKPVLDSANAVNKSEIFIKDVIYKIRNNNNMYQQQCDYAYEISGETYQFEKDESFKYLEILLGLIGKAKHTDYVINQVWLYIEHDSLLDSPHEFYGFFICQDLNIVVDYISLSVTYEDVALMKNILIESEYPPSLYNEYEDERARIRLCYDKWQTETVPGKIYAMKLKMKREEELAEEYGHPIADERVNDIRQLALRIHNQLFTIKVLLAVICVAIFGVIFYK